MTPAAIASVNIDTSGRSRSGQSVRVSSSGTVRGCGLFSRWIRLDAGIGSAYPPSGASAARTSEIQRLIAADYIAFIGWGDSMEEKYLDAIIVDSPPKPSN